MVRDTKIIRSNSFNAGQITAYPPLGAPQVSSPPKTAEPPSRYNGTDLVDISAEGRKAQTQLDIENLLQNLKQKNPEELSPQEKKLLANRPLTHLGTAVMEQPWQPVIGYSASSHPLFLNTPSVTDTLPAIGSERQIDSSIASMELQPAEQNTLQAENALGAGVQSSLQKVPLTAQAESMTVRAMAELQPRRVPPADLNGTPRQQVLYPPNSSTHEPMWVNVFA